MINRNTIQCSMVLEAVNKLKCHATAVEVYDEVGMSSYQQGHRIPEPKPPFPDWEDTEDRDTGSSRPFRPPLSGALPYFM